MTAPAKTFIVRSGYLIIITRMNIRAKFSLKNRTALPGARLNR